MAQQLSEVVGDGGLREESPAGGAAREHSPAGTRAALLLLVTAVALGGAAVAGLGGWSWQSGDLAALLLLALLAATAERWDISLYGGSRLSVAFVAIFSAALLFGLWGLTVVVAVAMVASAVGVDRPLHKTLFNFGALMLAGGGSVLILDRFGEASRPDLLPEAIGPAAVAAAANFAINSLLVALAVALSTGHGVRTVWEEKFRWLWPHYLVLGAIGLAIAAAYTAMGLWGILVFLAPPVMMRISMKQYLDRTSRSVMELREAHDQVVATMDTLSRAYDGTLSALVAALDARDSETGGHSERVAELSIAMAEAMGVAPGGQEWLNIQRGALLHDVGKIAIPDEILRKPASLSEAEWAAMRTHPETGHQIIRTVEFLAPAAEIVRAHHERYDGSGYPRGLRGDEIPLGARIFAVADAFDAMTSDRPYRRALPREEALAEILRNSGSQFDPTAVRTFLGVFEKRFLRDSPPHSPDGGISDSLKKAILEAAGLGGQP